MRALLRQQGRRKRLVPAGVSLSIADPSFSSVTVASPQEMLRTPADTLGQALENKPGLATTSFAPGASRPVIRGLTGFRVSTQENGLGTGDVASLSDDHGVPIDPMAAGQVEVVRGPPLRHGRHRRRGQRQQQPHPG
jgi:iron complex outermembrane receptor protein